MVVSHHSMCGMSLNFDVSVESEYLMLCRVGSSDHCSCVDGELAALVRRVLSDVVSTELVQGSCEVRTLYKARSVQKM